MAVALVCLRETISRAGYSLWVQFRDWLYRSRVVVAVCVLLSLCSSPAAMISGPMYRGGIEV
ncbi:hypothetical protein KCP75_04285 [Salmonella enterica subsp. enterica]|nr:hypothetical protein KCP75_04285 [Salmonella enterica subsp. enterica]